MTDTDGTFGSVCGSHVRRGIERQWPIVVDRWVVKVVENSSTKSGAWFSDGPQAGSILNEKYFQEQIQIVNMTSNNRVGVTGSTAEYNRIK